MIIALPATGHDHLADALVRDLGFTRTHVDAPLRDLLEALDPFVDSGMTLANMGPSPRLSSKLEQAGGWERLLNPPRPGAASDRTAEEVKRLLEVLRESASVKRTVYVDDTVIVGISSPQQADDAVVAGAHLVAISDRIPSWEPVTEYDHGLRQINHWISPAGVVGEQQQIVTYVQELRTKEQGMRELMEMAVPTPVSVALATLSGGPENSPA